MIGQSVYHCIRSYTTIHSSRPFLATNHRASNFPSFVMDVKTLLNNLHEEVSCSVCMTTFTDPKLLPCLHSFCLHCLEGIQRTTSRHDIIICPECRRESRVPSGSLNDLPTNFRINSLLDVLAIKQCNTTGVQCGNCDKKSSESYEKEYR